MSTSPSKISQLQNIPYSDKDLVSRLFSTARNLAIEAMLLRLTVLLATKGFQVICTWHETSFGPPIINIRTYNPKPKENSWEYGEVMIYCKREVLLGVPDNLSQCYYTVDSWGSSYWSRIPKLIADQEAAIKILFDVGYFHAEVEKVNYPFDNPTYSSF